MSLRTPSAAGPSLLGPLARRWLRRLGSVTLLAQVLALGACSVGGVTEADSGNPNTANPAGGNTEGNQGPASIVLKVAKAYMIQVQQREDGSIPMVAGRDAYLRVFLTADRSNSATPTVRARLYSGTNPIFTATMNPPASSVPQTAGSSGDWNSSYNVYIPGKYLTPGVGLRIDADPNAQIDGAVRGTYPSDGTLATPKVVQVAPFPAVAVAIATPNPQGGAPLVGNLTASNIQTYYQLALQVLPIQKYTLTLRPGTFSINRILGADGSNWGAALNDLQTAQYADPNGRTSYWFGITLLPYKGAGVCGIDVTPGQTGLAEDDAFLNMAWAQQSVAHEEGHAFGLLHTPCNGPASVDPSWPTDSAHAGAKIGTWGLNVAQAVSATPNDPGAQLIAPTSTDIMSYCTETWLADYTYAKALANQTVNTRSTDASPTALAQVYGKTMVRSSHLVLSGQVRDGRIEIEHAVRALGVDQFPPPGPYTITGLDAAGKILFSVNFAPTPLTARLGPGEHGSGDPLQEEATEGTFLIAVPLADDQLVSQYQFGHPYRNDQYQQRSTEAQNQILSDRRAPSQADLNLRAEAQPSGPGLPALVTLRWDASLYTKAFVREGASLMIGTIQDGEGQVLSDADELSVVFTDGMDSVTQKVHVEK